MPLFKCEGARVESCGQSVRMMREKAGFSQGELARRVGVSQARISQIENGVHGVPVGTVLDIAKACGFELQLKLK